MKMNKLVMLMVSGGLAFSLMTGCGGGGGDGEDIPQPGVGVTPEKVNDFVGDMADEMGCDYTELATSLSTKTDLALSFDTVGFIKKVIVSGKNLREVAQAPIISATQPGTCGGSVTIPDDLSVGGTISLTNYCSTEEATGIQTIINGSLAIAMDEATSTITLSTPTTLTIASTNPETGTPVNVSINLDNATIKINEDESIKITIAALTITDNVTKKQYTITNLIANMVGDIVTFSATFNNPEVTGAVNAVGSINGTTGEGTITVTDQNGAKVKLSSTSTEGVFNVSFDNAPLGTMDCSTVAIPVIPAI